MAVWDAGRIDEVNILQATMEGMRSAVRCVAGHGPGEVGGKTVRIETEASISADGCYVVHGATDAGGNPVGFGSDPGEPPRHALVDGNRVPSDLPCPSEPMVKGDSREYCIAAASILAKVTRDRLMHGYDGEYPAYGLGKHKGYPTKGHRAKVREVGASPIHRRSFAPLKNMVFDGEGWILEDNN